MYVIELISQFVCNIDLLLIRVGIIFIQTPSLYAGSNFVIHDRKQPLQAFFSERNENLKKNCSV
jgi:hypothetical protein